MIRGIDASMDVTPYMSNLQALGVNFVGRYYTNLSATKNPGKVLSPREAHDLSQAGFSLVVVWEFLATPGYFSNAQGQADGESAYRYAIEMIRQPEGSAIYFAVDFDATQAQFNQAVLPYFEGIAQSFANVSGNRPPYSVGVYGSGAVCAALKQAGLARYAWLSQSTGWQGSRTYQNWDLRQGPLVSHPPFQFDEDIANEQFGAFRITFENDGELFETVTVSKTQSELVEATRDQSKDRAVPKRRLKKR